MQTPNPPSELLKRLLEASAESPLSEANPASLDELMNRIPQIFNKTPLDLNDNDIVDSVLYFRAKRAMFSQLARERADAGPTTRKSTKRPSAPSSEDLGI